MLSQDFADERFKLEDLLMGYGGCSSILSGSIADKYNREIVVTDWVLFHF